jgi:hypothetical protein
MASTNGLTRRLESLELRTGLGDGDGWDGIIHVVSPAGRCLTCRRPVEACAPGLRVHLRVVDR